MCLFAGVMSQETTRKDDNVVESFRKNQERFDLEFGYRNGATLNRLNPPYLIRAKVVVFFEPSLERTESD